MVTNLVVAYLKYFLLRTLPVRKPRSTGIQMKIGTLALRYRTALLVRRQYLRSVIERSGRRWRDCINSVFDLSTFLMDMLTLPQETSSYWAENMLGALLLRNVFVCQLVIFKQHSVVTVCF